jgi:hypothetical protein
LEASRVSFSRRYVVNRAESLAWKIGVLGDVHCEDLALSPARALFAGGATRSSGAVSVVGSAPQGDPSAVERATRLESGDLTLRV